MVRAAAPEPSLRWSSHPGQPNTLAPPLAPCCRRSHEPLAPGSGRERDRWHLDSGSQERGDPGTVGSFSGPGNQGTSLPQVQMQKRGATKEAGTLWDPLGRPEGRKKFSEGSQCIAPNTVLLWCNQGTPGGKGARQVRNTGHVPRLPSEGACMGNSFMSPVSVPCPFAPSPQLCARSRESCLVSDHLLRPVQGGLAPTTNSMGQGGAQRVGMATARKSHFPS